MNKEETAENFVQGHISIPTEWSDITMREFCEFKRAEQHLNKLINEKEQLTEEERADSNHDLEIYLATIDMLSPVLRVPSDRLLQILSTQHHLTEVFAEVMGVFEKPLPGPNDIKRTFTFADRPLSEIRKLDREITETKNPFKRKRLRKQLKKAVSVEYFIGGDLLKDTFEQWIYTEAARDRVRELQEKLDAGHWEVLPEIIAYVARPKDEERFDPKTVEPRKEIMKDLPVPVCIMVCNFFLRLRKRQLEITKTFSVNSRVRKNLLK